MREKKRLYEQQKKEEQKRKQDMNKHYVKKNKTASIVEDQGETEGKNNMEGDEGASWGFGKYLSHIYF